MKTVPPVMLKKKEVQLEVETKAVNGNISSQTCSPLDCLEKGQQTYAGNRSHRFSEHAVVGEQWDEKSNLAHDNVRPLQRFVWVYCPGHAGVKENDRRDTTARKTFNVSGLRLGRLARVWREIPEVLRSARHCLLTQSPKHRAIDRPEGTGITAKVSDLPRKDGKGPVLIKH